VVYGRRQSPDPPPALLRCRLAARANGSYPFRRRFESAHRTPFSPLAQGASKRLITVRSRFESWRDYPQRFVAHGAVAAGRPLYSNRQRGALERRDSARSNRAGGMVEPLYPNLVEGRASEARQ
jgi:hypothetical protein